MIIDSHTHILPPEIAKNPPKNLPSFWKKFAPICTVDNLIEMFRKANIDGGIVLPAGAAILSWSMEKVNDFITNSAKEHKNLIGFGWVNPNLETATFEMERCVKELKLKGFGEFHPLVQNFKLNSCKSIIEKAIELEVPIIFHFDKRTNFIEFLNLAKAYRNAKIICAHLGAGLFEKTDISFYYDTSFGKNLELALKRVGTDRILFGTDFPFAKNPKLELEKILRLEVPDEEKKEILGGNVLKLVK